MSPNDIYQLMVSYQQMEQFVSIFYGYDRLWNHLVKLKNTNQLIPDVSLMHTQAFSHMMEYTAKTTTDVPRCMMHSSLFNFIANRFRLLHLKHVRYQASVNTGTPSKYVYPLMTHAAFGQQDLTIVYHLRHGYEVNYFKREVDPDTGIEEYWFRVPECRLGDKIGWIPLPGHLLNHTVPTGISITWVPSISMLFVKLVGTSKVGKSIRIALDVV